MLFLFCFIYFMKQDFLLQRQTESQFHQNREISICTTFRPHSSLSSCVYIMSFMQKDPVQNQALHDCHISSVSFSLPQLLRVNFLDFDAFEDYRPVILCNVSQFGFVCYFFLIRLVVEHIWQKYNKSIMLRFSFCIPLCGHDINLSHFVGFKFIYLIKEVSAGLFPCKDMLLHFVRNFWGVMAVVLENLFFFFK